MVQALTFRNDPKLQSLRQPVLAEEKTMTANVG
jgi:hypothetical protein